MKSGTCVERNIRASVNRRCERKHEEKSPKKREDRKRERRRKRRGEESVRGRPVWRRRAACIYQHRARRRKKKKPPGTETPVNSGNKKMIKSDLMSRRRQAKTHICHSETDVTAPPAHFSLPPSLTRSHSSSHSFIHYTLMFSPIEAPDRTAPAPRSLPS